tara:strand:- start:180 stop:368 length:189 start_codon:yes stop_codon:yes gene_type:complete
MFDLKMIKKKQEIIIWSIWLVLVIFWNFCYPEAKPFYDVLIAVILSLIFILIKKNINMIFKG